MTCHKIRYRTLHAARVSLRFCQRKGREECGVYYCRCQAWHLTSKGSRS